MLTSGGNTKATTGNTTAASRIQRLGEGRFASPPMLTHQMKRSPPAGLVEEVKDHVKIELDLISHSLFFILIIRLDERPINEKRTAHDVGSGHKAPVTAIEADGAVISHGKVAPFGNHEVLALDVIGKFERPGWRYISALRGRHCGKIIPVGKVV